MPSTNESATFYRINPGNGNQRGDLLVDAGILYKRRGIGMFANEGSREIILKGRRKQFEAASVRPLGLEARTLGIPESQLAELISVITKEDIA